jgi:hypothetical protein
MSVYHKWRTVFVQIPKNASSSIHKVLENQTDLNHNHRTYIEVLSENDPELIESYYSFAICRNPYDRFVSAYEYMKQNSGGEWNPTFEEAVDEFHSRGSHFYTTEDIIFWPQHRFVTIKNIILVDDIIKYEEMNNQWSNIVEKICKTTPSSFSKPGSIIPRENITYVREERKWQDYYNDDLKDKVYHLYKKDFELFGYKK